MKKKTAVLLTALFTVAGLSAFGQGWMNFQTANNYTVWDEFTTPGTGAKPVASSIDVALLWATAGAVDPLSNVGGSTVPNQSNSGGGGVTDQVATNGVASSGVFQTANAIAALLADGWTVGTVAAGSPNGTAGAIIDETVTTSKASVEEYAGGVIQLAGASGDVQMIMIAWSGGAAALSDLTTNSLTGELALGWSNPMTYQLGTAATDSNGAADLDESHTQIPAGYNLNSFGIAPTIVPEPATLALAGLGGLSLLLFRRRS